MNARSRLRRLAWAAGGFATLLAVGLAAMTALTHEVEASGPCQVCPHPQICDGPIDGPGCGDWAGSWYWLRSPEQERRVIASLYNRYCIRCHGVDGRGVWDIPDVPDFTNARWQACRSDAQLARIILEGRGAVMPAFRGTLTLEESWAMARYLRTFVPGTEASRPDYKEPGKPAEELPAPKTVDPKPASLHLPILFRPQR